MKRRHFLPIAAAGPLWRPAAWSAGTVQPQFRRPPQYFAYRPLIADGADEFGRLPQSQQPQAPAPVADPWFADVTGSVLEHEQFSRGIPYWLARMDPATGIDIYGNNGIAVGDIDNDGVDEVYVCQPAGLPNRLLKWRDGKWTDISEGSGVDLLDNTASALFADLRNSGYQDLVVLIGSGPVLFLNDGQGRWEWKPDAFRFATPPKGVFTGMAAADYDGDGRLDLYCCCYSFFQSEAQYSYPTPYFDAQNGPPNFLFHNRLVEGYFEDVTAAVGLDHNNNRYSFAPAWCDYDGSGRPSLYVANDFGRNNLYRNERGRFRDIAAEAGVEDIGPGMSAAWFDEDGDGRPDLYVANMWTAGGMAVVRTPEFQRRFPESLGDVWRRHSKGNSLYRNLGNGRFEDIGARRGAEMGRWAWSCDAADLDNDGSPEIFITCGMLTGPKQPDLMNFFWRQVVAKSPADATRSTAYEAGWNAINQFMREGYSWNGNEPNVFYRREGERYKDRSAESGLGFVGDSRAFALTDFDGDGCLDVLVKNRLAPQVRVFQNRCGQGRDRVGLRLVGVKSNRDGIGARVAVGKQVKWLAAGSGYLSQHTKTLYFGLPAGMAPVEITWPSGVRQRLERLEPNALYEVTEGKGARLVRRFTEAPAIPAKPGKADNEPRLHDTWLQDPVPLPEKVTGPLMVLNERLLQKPDMFAAYSIFRRYLFEFRAELEFPFAMLLNREGQAVKIYARVPSPDQVSADVKAIGRQSALPFPGRWLSQPRRDYFKLGAALLWSGYGEQALPYLELVLRQQPDNARTMVLAAQIHREAGRHREATTLLDDALKIDPSLSEAWNEMGGVALAENRLEDALGHFRQALSGKPDLLYALLNAAQTASQMRRTEAAEEYYRKAVTAHPASADAANGLGLLLARSGRGREAEQQLKEATRLDPALASAWNNLAVLYLNQKRTVDAVAALEEGIRHSPSDETLYLNLGRYYVQAGDREKARDTMRRLLKAKPDSAIARKALEDLR